MDATPTSWLGNSSDLQQLIRVAVRLLAAMIAGAVIGAQREWSGKNAGFRTHILVAGLRRLRARCQ